MNEAYQAPFAGTVKSPVTENEQMITGNWRMIRPVVDAEKCTQCLNCWLSCPDACINPHDDGMKINYKYCKGCRLCIKQCLFGAITGVPELEFSGEEE